MSQPVDHVGVLREMANAQESFAIEADGGEWPTLAKQHNANAKDLRAAADALEVAKKNTDEALKQSSLDVAYQQYFDRFTVDTWKFQDHYKTFEAGAQYLARRHGLLTEPSPPRDKAGEAE